MRRVCLWFVMLVWLLLFWCAAAASAETGEDLQTEETAREDGVDGIREMAEEQIWESLELDEIDRSLSEILEYRHFSFRDTVLALMRGELPFEPETLREIAADAVLGEVAQVKKLALQVILIVLTAAVFSNFSRVFHSSQVADICYYMMYLLVSVLLMQSFGILNGTAARSVLALIRMMQVLLPAYLLTIVFCAGTLTATGYSEVLLFAFSMTEAFLVNIMIPAVNFYLVLQVLNQMSREDYFSKFAELAETAVSWGLKTILGIIVGLQAVQCLIAPAVDALKSGALHRAAKAIPGIGNTLDSAAETIAGCAVVIKNAVGAGGMTAILLLCLVPVCKIVFCILALRVLSAVIQPMGESRLAECVSCAAEAAALLLRIVLTAMGIFMISTAIIMASVRG